MGSAPAPLLPEPLGRPAGDTGEILAHGFYSVSRSGKAEVPLEVADSMRGMGIWTLLVGQLAQAADAAGIEVFEAEVLTENHPAWRTVTCYVRRREAPFMTAEVIR